MRHRFFVTACVVLVTVGVAAGFLTGCAESLPVADAATEIAAEPYDTPAEPTPEPTPQPVTEQAIYEVDAEDVLKDFLRQFPTLFFDVPIYRYFNEETGNAYNWAGEPAEYLPAFFRTFYGGLHHRDGSVVSDDAPFVSHGAVAIHFNLYHLDDSGFPVIAILFAFETWGWHELFRFVDGEYRSMGTFSWPRFFKDTQGRLLMGTFEAGATGPGDGLHYVVWDADGADMRLVPIISFMGESWDDFVWFNYLTGEYSDFCMYTGDWLNPPDVPYTPLTPIGPLTELEEQLLETISGSL